MPPQFGKGIVGVRTLGSGPSVQGGTGSILPPGFNLGLPGGGYQNPQPPLGGGGQKPPTAAPPIPTPAQDFSSPVPGVSGITPGAVERRLAGLNTQPPTGQANPQMGLPPTAQAGLILGNTVGTDPRNLQDPIMMIRELLRSGGSGQI